MIRRFFRFPGTVLICLLVLLLWAGALILVAYLSREVAHVLNAAFSLRGLTSGALLGSLFLVLFWRKGTALPIFVGMIGSFLAMIYISQFEWTISESPELVKGKVAWPWYTLIGTCISFTFLNPYSHQSNLMVLRPGGYSTATFVRFGIPLTLAVAASAVGVGWALLTFTG